MRLRQWKWLWVAYELSTEGFRMQQGRCRQCEQPWNPVPVITRLWHQHGWGWRRWTYLRRRRSVKLPECQGVLLFPVSLKDLNLGEIKAVKIIHNGSTIVSNAEPVITRLWQTPISHPRPFFVPISHPLLANLAPTFWQSRTHFLKSRTHCV